MLFGSLVACGEPEKDAGGAGGSAGGSGGRSGAVGGTSASAGTTPGRGSLDFVQFIIPTTGARALSLTPGPDGNVWFTENVGAKIGSITPEGTITEFPVPVGTFIGLTDITLGPDGNLWFTNNGEIGSITPDGTLMPQFRGDLAVSITTGPDGNLWFRVPAPSVVSRRPGSTRDSNLKPGSMSTTSPPAPTAISGSPIEGGGGLGRITPEGEITEFEQANSNLGAIVTGPDGNLWFTEYSENAIGRITPSGTIEEFPLPVGTGPRGITIGPDGNLWFHGIVQRRDRPNHAGRRHHRVFVIWRDRITV
ncbi:MAG: virginiamycin B lyase [Pseudomonadota bacterium]